MTEPIPQPIHCRICHADVEDYPKHFRVHHESSGGFPAKCEIVQCPKWLREQPADNHK